MSEKKETKVNIQQPEDTSTPLRTEPEYSQKDVFNMLQQLEEASATQFNQLAEAYQAMLDNYGTNMQMQFELAKYPFGGTLSPLTQQFLDSAKQHKEKVEEELNGDSRQD